jgi:hypothetical protein
MKKKILKNLPIMLLIAGTFSSGCTKSGNPDKGTLEGAIIINHSNTKINSIPEEWISRARQDLHIAYSHTSHGSQLIDGMTGLVGFKGSLYNWNNGGTDNALDIHDYAMPGDLGNPDRTRWAAETRTYLSSHGDVNVIMWAWCGQVSGSTEEDINTYLDLMSSLEKDYMDVKFVYMTGHLDGTGLSGTLHIRNEQIRNYCKNNDKILFDFEDIESYNPDNIYYGNKKPDDGCNYDTNNDGTPDGNWAIEWQESHIEGIDWYDCQSAHSQPLNANQKAYAAWWLWALLAGWDGK